LLVSAAEVAVSELVAVSSSVKKVELDVGVGDGDANGDGAGEANGVGVGEASGVGVGEINGDGVGVGVGLGDGVLVGVGDGGGTRVDSVSWPSAISITCKDGPA